MRCHSEDSKPNLPFPTGGIFPPTPGGRGGFGVPAYDDGAVYDVAFILGISLPAIGGLLVVVSRLRTDTPEAEIDRRFDEIVGRLGD